MLTSRLVPKIARNMAVRNNAFYAGSIVSGPPTKHVPFVEKVGLGLVMVSSFMIIPTWVLLHLEGYKNRA